MAQSLLKVIQGAYLWQFRRSANKFMHALRQPEQAQGARLKRMLRNNRFAQYGQAFGFSGISSISDFQRKVPIVKYRDLEPWIGRIADGESQVLTSEKVLMMELVGGASSPHKLIPFTRSHLADVAAATQPWLYDLHTALPKLRGLPSYWAMTPVNRPTRETPGGIRIGFQDDAAYLGLPSGWSLRQVRLDTPAPSDIDNWRHETVRTLLQTEELGMMSVWSPTFLTLLMRYAEENLATLLNELPRKRAQTIARAVDASGMLLGTDIWPDLQIISCWTEANAATFLPDLERLFPGTPIQSKGLFFTEGVVSTPLWGLNGSALAVNSHFLEFRDLANPNRRPLLAHELEVDGCYNPIVTTASGLYRYDLGDIIRCVGFHSKTPRVTYEAKRDDVSDLTGEKLALSHVEKGLRAATREAGIDINFALVAPSIGHTPRYRLYIESSATDAALKRAAQLLDDKLKHAPSYAYCRQLGQLAAIEVKRVTDGWQKYRQTLVSRGAKVNEVAPLSLDRQTIWDQVFESRKFGAA